jgi:cell division protein ZapA
MDHDIGTVPVEIFGQTYTLRGQGDGAYLRDLAAHVDAKMREISDSTRTADTLKIAILAALNITDEYYQLRRARSDKAARDFSGKAGELVEMLDRVLREEKER